MKYSRRGRRGIRMEEKKATGRDYTRKVTQWELWRKKIEAVKKSGAMPHQWLSSRALAHFLALIDPYLLYMDHVAIFNLLGYQIKPSTDEWIEKNKPWIAIETLKKLMDCPEYSVVCDEILTKRYGDGTQLLGKKALHQLGVLIDEKHFPSIVVALEMAKLYARRFEKTETEKERAEKLKKMINKFSPENVEKLGDNH